MTFFDVVRNALLAGLGIQQTVKEFVDELVKKGELSESEGAKLLKEWAEKTGKSSELLSKTVSELVSKAMEKMNVPTKKDLEEVEREIRSLSRRVDKLEEKP
jgi:polyhydroxyalkanoate synthesis regulator phasin